MSVAKQISNLLYDNECVIIPGLGGFLSRYTSASINNASRSIIPPSKKIIFNERLKDDDGLLVNQLLNSEIATTKDEAIIKINEFVAEINNALKNGKVFLLKDIGTLKLSQSKRLIFISTDEVNYLSDTFGLTVITSTPIKRESIEKRQKEQPVVNRAVEVVEKQMPSSVKWTTLITLPLIVLIMWGSFNKKLINDLSRNYSGFFSTIVLSDNSYIPETVAVEEISEEKNVEEVEMADSEKVVEEIVEIDLHEEEIIETEVVVKKEIIEEVKAIEIESETPTVVENTKKLVVHKKTPTYIVHKVKDLKFKKSKNKSSKKTSVNNNVINGEKYYIIGGAFATRYSAEKCMKKIKRQGYNPIVVECKAKNLFRVSYIQPNNSLEDARALVNEIKSKANPKAWLLVI